MVFWHTHRYGYLVIRIQSKGMNVKELNNKKAIENIDRLQQTTMGQAV